MDHTTQTTPRFKPGDHVCIGAVVDQVRYDPDGERWLYGLSGHGWYEEDELAPGVGSALDPRDCTCRPGEGCDQEGDPGCRYCQLVDQEWPCPAEVEDELAPGVGS